MKYTQEQYDAALALLVSLQCDVESAVRLLEFASYIGATLTTVNEAAALVDDAK